MSFLAKCTTESYRGLAMLANEMKFKEHTFAAEQFELWFQPVYTIVSGDILHNEVLLRWQNHQGFVYLPQDFLRLISNFHMSQWLDRLVIRRAIKLLANQPNLRLSVNLTEDILCDFTIVDYIQALITKYQLQPGNLSLELSENTIAKDCSTAAALIRELKTLGCLVVLDGFTNQRFSFLQWKELQVDLVKISSSLIQQLGASNSNLIRDIAETSRCQGQLIIAKSVDGSVPPDELVKQGIVYAQGDYFKSPSPHLSSTNKVNILNVPIDNLSKNELLEQLKSGTLFTPNVDHLIKLRRDKEFLQAYNIADYKVCDSQVLFYTSKFLGLPIKEKISGSDFFPAFYHHHRNNENITIFLLGGTDGIASRAKEKINYKVQRNIVVDSYSPSFGFENNEQECLEIIEMINRSKATVLAIGVGAPKQEKWLYKYKDRLLNIKIFLAIGATIDFEAGKVKRAPKLISRLGLEWLYRLVSEPKRLWRRYLVDSLSFFPLIMQQRLKF